MVVAQQDRQYFVMYASIDSDAELVGYPVAVRDFKSQARGEHFAKTKLAL